MIVRIAATPEFETDGPKLADEILEAIGGVTRDLDDGTGEWRTVPRAKAEREQRKDEQLQAAGDRVGRFGDGDGTSGDAL